MAPDPRLDSEKMTTTPLLDLLKMKSSFALRSTTNKEISRIKYRIFLPID